MESKNCSAIVGDASILIRVPPKGIREKFFILYELEGCQKAINFLTEYYGTKRMKINLNGRKVGNGNHACYTANRAYFSKKSLTKNIILHELYHHLVYSRGLDKPDRIEDKEANNYAKTFLKKKARVSIRTERKIEG